MKLSNKILIGFFGLIFLYLTAVFAEVRLRGNLNVLTDDNSITETVELDAVSHLVLENMKSYVRIKGAGQARLEVRSLTGDRLKEVHYSVSGDTVKLSNMESKMREMQITVFVPDHALKHVELNSASATLDQIRAPRLDVTLNDGNVWLNENTLETVRVNASNGSYFQCYSSEVDTLIATVVASELHVSVPLKLLEGSIEDGSFVRVFEVDQIQFRTDKSSTLNLVK